MRPRETVGYEDRLDNLTKKQLTDDDELVAHRARYLCVLACGYLEVSTRASLSAYASDKSSPVIARYVNRQVEQFRNPKLGKLCDLLNRFDAAWGKHLKEWSEGKIKDHVESLVANRHLIAHGRSSGVTIVTVRDWIESAKKLTREIEKLCDVQDVQAV